MSYLWFHPSVLFNTNNYIIILLALVSTTGDYIVTHTKLHLFQALFDNATHAAIGGLSWFFVCINFKNRSHLQTLFEIGACAGIASLIDVDHFVSARSFYLKVRRQNCVGLHCETVFQDATSLQKRPPLHCSTFPLVCCLLVLLGSYFFQVDL
jgi:hypothetical protein